jgi:hypothetical protein
MSHFTGSSNYGTMPKWATVIIKCVLMTLFGVVFVGITLLPLWMIFILTLATIPFLFKAVKGK